MATVRIRNKSRYRIEIVDLGVGAILPGQDRTLEIPLDKLENSREIPLMISQGILRVDIEGENLAADEDAIYEAARAAATEATESIVVVTGYVSDSTDATLTRSGSGPYSLGLTLSNPNTWTGTQTFSGGVRVLQSTEQGWVLTSDGSGNASWGALSSSASSTYSEFLGVYPASSYAIKAFTNTFLSGQTVSATSGPLLTLWGSSTSADAVTILRIPPITPTQTVRQTITASSVTLATNSILYPGHGLAEGQEITYYHGGGAPMTKATGVPLTNGGAYYAKSVNATSYSVSEAASADALDLDGQGSNSQYFQSVQENGNYNIIHTEATFEPNKVNDEVLAIGFNVATGGQREKPNLGGAAWVLEGQWTPIGAEKNETCEAYLEVYPKSGSPYRPFMWRVDYNDPTGAAGGYGMQLDNYFTRMNFKKPDGTLTSIFTPTEWDIILSPSHDKGISITHDGSTAQIAPYGGAGSVNFNAYSWMGTPAGVLYNSVASLSVPIATTSQNVTSPLNSLATYAGNGYTKGYVTYANANALGAVASGNVTICTLPALTVVRDLHLYISVTASGVGTLTGSVGVTGADYTDMLTAFDLKSAQNTIWGNTNTDRGANLSGYYLPSVSGTTDIKMHLEATGGNLNAVTGLVVYYVLETQRF